VISELRGDTWDHAVLPAYNPTQVNTPRLTPVRQAGTRLTYPGGMECWVDLGHWLRTEMVPGSAQPEVERTTCWSQVRRQILHYQAPWSIEQSYLFTHICLCVFIRQWLEDDNALPLDGNHGPRKGDILLRSKIYIWFMMAMTTTTMTYFVLK